MIWALINPQSKHRNIQNHWYSFKKQFWAYHQTGLQMEIANGDNTTPRCELSWVPGKRFSQEAGCVKETGQRIHNGCNFRSVIFDWRLILLPVKWEWFYFSQIKNYTENIMAKNKQTWHWWVFVVTCTSWSISFIIQSYRHRIGIPLLFKIPT